MSDNNKILRAVRTYNNGFGNSTAAILSVAEVLCEVRNYTSEADLLADADKLIDYLTYLPTGADTEAHLSDWMKGTLYVDSND